MSGITVWHDPMSLRYYLEEGHVIEEIHPVTRRFIEGLNADKDKLQEQVEQLFDEAFNLSVENAKLRGLCKDMMRFFEDGDYCTACEKAAECDAQEEYDDSCLMRGVFHARMRELGVDDGD